MTTPIRAWTRSLLCLALLVVAVALAPAARAQHEQDGHAPAGAAEHAATDADHETVEVIPNAKQGLIVGLANILVFLIVLSVLAVTVWPKINRGLAEREAKIKGEIESAEAARKQARDALEQYERSLADARNEAQKMLEATKSQQQALAADLRAKAEVELNGLREKARRDIESAKRAALSEIYTEASTLASHMAGKILRRSVTPEDQRKLVEESLDELQALKA